MCPLQRDAVINSDLGSGVKLLVNRVRNCEFIASLTIVPPADVERSRCIFACNPGADLMTKIISNFGFY